MSVADIKLNIGVSMKMLYDESVKIVETSSSVDDATKAVMSHISLTIAAKSRGYIAGIYTSLLEETLALPEFKDNIDNQNKLFDLRLEDKIIHSYNFDTSDSAAYRAGLDYQEINRTYTSAAVAAGSATAGGILLGVLSGAVDIPVFVIIAGAVLCGLGGGAVSYCKVVPDKNKKRFEDSIRNLLSVMDGELRSWVDGVVAFYHKEVDALRATL